MVTILRQNVNKIIKFLKLFALNCSMCYNVICIFIKYFQLRKVDF